MMKWIKLIINGWSLFGVVYTFLDFSVELKKLQFYDGAWFLLLLIILFLITGKAQEMTSVTEWLKGEDK